MGLSLEQLPSKKKAETEEDIDWGFIRGEIPFQYSHIFSTGERIEAFQDKQGLGRIRIKNREGAVFNASTLLPEGWKFVTPAYFKNFPEEESLLDYVGGGWETSHDRKLILLGKFASPQDFLLLLHEIGHAQSDTAEDIKAQEEAERELFDIRSSKGYKKEGDRSYEVLLEEDVAKLVSKMERRAWAWAVLALRRIQKDTGINAKNFFPALQDLQEYIDNCLASHRQRFDWIVKYDLDFPKELRKMFERWGKYRPRRHR